MQIHAPSRRIIRYRVLTSSHVSGHLRQDHEPMNYHDKTITSKVTRQFASDSADSASMPVWAVRICVLVFGNEARV